MTPNELQNFTLPYGLEDLNLAAKSQSGAVPMPDSRGRLKYLADEKRRRRSRS
jgi:hypothetical protein